VTGVPARPPGGDARLSTRHKTKTASARGLIKKISKTLEPKLAERCRYCFGGVVAGGLVAGAAGLLPGDVPGLTGLGATLPAAGAATPDCTL
jgi:hypothetical protein